MMLQVEIVVYVAAADVGADRQQLLDHVVRALDFDAAASSGIRRLKSA